MLLVLVFYTHLASYYLMLHEVFLRYKWLATFWLPFLFVPDY
jgi:hypothetical protein